MIVLNVTYHCKPALREAFLERIRSEGVDVASRAEAGNLKYDYYIPFEDSDDLLYEAAGGGRWVAYPGERIPTRNNHGTGCTLSSAIAAHLALGHPLEEAVRRAKAYITGAIRAGAEYRVGKGHGPVHHFWQWY